MNVNKRNNYQLTGSIHTLSLISLPVTDIDESIAPCFDTLYSIYQLLTHSPKEIKGNYEIYESDNIKIKVGKEK